MTAFEWMIFEQGIEPPQEVYNKTRDILQARLEHAYGYLIANDWNLQQASLLTAILGELTGNVFDHNLGQWKDIPGCWFDIKIFKEKVTVIIADRGQGLFASLKRVCPQLKDDMEALYIAFTERLSGRAPEQRGNGLKFVIRSLGYFSDVIFSFQSGNAELSFRTKEMDVLNNLFNCLKKKDQIIHGVYIEMTIFRL